MSKSTKIVDELLKGSAPPRHRSPMDKYPELIGAIVRFLDLKKAGDARVLHISMSWFYMQKLRPKFKGPSRETAFGYIRNVLGRDPVTGKKL